MLFKYFIQKICKLSLFSTILLGFLIYSNFSKSHNILASTPKNKTEDTGGMNQEQEIDYKQSDKYFGRGLGYSLRGESEIAIDNFSKAIAFNPENFSAYVSRGNIYLERSEWDKALADYDRAIEIYPQLNGRIYYHRGIIYNMRGKLEQALADYNRAIELKSYFHPAYFQRGLIYLRQENWLDAIEDFEQVIELEPKEEQAYFNAGFGYLNIQEWDKALEKYNQGIAINPNDGAAYFNRGFIQANNGNKLGAIVDWQQAQKIFLEKKDMSSYQMVEQFLDFLHNSLDDTIKSYFYSETSSYLS